MPSVESLGSVQHQVSSWTCLRKCTIYSNAQLNNYNA